jgi:hypothetical protein
LIRSSERFAPRELIKRRQNTITTLIALRFLWSNILAESERLRTRPQRRARGTGKVLHARPRIPCRTGCAAPLAVKLRAGDGAPVGVLPRVVLLCYHRDDQMMVSLGLETRAFPRGRVLEQGPVRCSVRVSKPFLVPWGVGGRQEPLSCLTSISGLALDELAEMGMAEASGR